MRTRNQFVIVLIALSSLMVMAPNGSSLAETPEPAHKPSDAPAKPAPPAAGKPAPGEGQVSAARKAAKARMARCRLHPEICVQ
jgi:hypothetical protein